MGASWSFPPFRLDPATGSLWRDEQLVALPPTPLAVLTCLLAQAGQVVTKETLLDAVWPEIAVTDEPCAKVRAGNALLRHPLEL
jgi:DNA-binding winged helix-turn-helix (wHTH) protein